MRAVWALDRPVPARVVHTYVAKSHKVEPLTVITVLNKLVDKGLLARAKQLEIYHYRARLSREEFMSATSRRLVEGILSLGPDAVAASLVDVLAERDPERLAELRRLIERRLETEGDA